LLIIPRRTTFLEGRTPPSHSGPAALTFIIAAVKRIPSLDGLRAISIVFVIAGHSFSQHHILSFASVYANTGVRIFFVISGYLITTLLLREHEKTGTISLRDFYIRRAYRILPAAFAYMVPVLILFWHDLRWYQAAAALLYLVNFDFTRPWFIGHLWSLGVEEQFYFLWPGALNRFFRHRVAILVGVIALAPLYGAVCFAFKVPSGGYGTFPAVADNLAVGCLLAVFRDRLPRINGVFALTMAAAILLIPQFPANTADRTLLMLFILWPMLNLSIAGVLLHVMQHPYRILNIGPMVFLGKISYSLYLWQQLFFFNPRPIPLGIALPGALTFACLSYYCIEQPMLRLRDARSQSSRPVLSLAPAGD
jgi:peptidoglycan/LPS O-acetylase OafA/YrhL